MERIEPSDQEQIPTPNEVTPPDTGTATTAEENADKVLRTLTRPHAKVEAFGRIIACVQEEYAKYIAAHPDRLDDRHTESLTCSVFGVGAILNILDDYDIMYKKEEDTGPNS